MNDIGEVVGDYVVDSDENDPNKVHRSGFLRSSKGDFTTFDVPGPDITMTIGEGINNAGTIVGAYVANGTIHGFVLNNGVVFTTVDVPDLTSGKAQETEINSINAKGEIVGFYNDSTGVRLSRGPSPIADLSHDN